MRIRSTCLCGLAVVALGTFALTGCNPTEPKKPKSEKRSGVVTKVDAASRKMAMKVRDPRNLANFLSRELEGAVTDTTEIMVNGRRATFADVKEGDDVEATGYAQGKGEDMKIVAEQIKVERAESVKSNPAPSTEGTSSPKTPAMQGGSEATKVTIPPKSDGMPTAGTQTAQSGQKWTIPPTGNNGVTIPAGPANPPVGTTIQQPTDPKAREQTFKTLVDEFRKQRKILVEKRDALIKSGKQSNDAEVMDIENKIRKADMYLAQVQDIGAQHGITAPDDKAASKPVAGAGS